MGQYHIPVNLDKKEFIYPHHLGCGLKLWEQAGSEYGTAAALVVLLAASNGRGGGDFEEGYADKNGTPTVGRWAGDRIAIVGDYAEDGDLKPEDEASTICELVFHAIEGARTGWTDVTALVADVLQKEYEFTYVGDGWKEVKPNNG